MGNRYRARAIVVWAVPIIGALIALAMWALIFYTWYDIISSRVVLYNPVNDQCEVANDLAAKAIKAHGQGGRVMLFEKHHGAWEYGYYNSLGQWCSLYRSLPLKGGVK